MSAARCSYALYRVLLVKAAPAGRAAFFLLRWYSACACSAVASLYPCSHAAQA